jgi:hypothetical protein
MKTLKYLLLSLGLAVCSFGQNPTLVNSNGDGITNPAFRNAVLPLQSGHTGKYLRTDGAGNITWETVASGSYVETSQLSTTGGANKVPQFDSNGNWTTGPFVNDSVIMGDGGNIYIPDMRGIEFLRRDGTKSGQRIHGWDEHGLTPGTPELLLQSPERIALVAYEGIQLGPNDQGRYPRFVRLASGLSSGALSATYPATEYMPSGVLFFETSVWNGSADYNDIALQAHALDTSGTNSELRIYDQAGINSAGTVSTVGRGDATGNIIARIHQDGVWSNGTAPTFEPLIPSDTVTIECSIYKTIQASRLTLDRDTMLAFSGALAGMRGVIYVTQPPSGSTWDLTPSGGTALALSTTNGYTDRVAWEFDGSFYNFDVTTNIQREAVVSDPDAQAFIAAAAITDPTQKVAIDTLIQSFKNTAPTDDSLWDQTHVAWPYVGGSATAHAINIKPTTTGSFVTGKIYTISVPGDTDFTAIGAANNNVGTVFTASGAGGGTTGKANATGTFGGTVSHTEHASGTIQGNGTNGYFNTGFNRNEAARDDVMFYVYTRSQTLTAAKWLFGSTGTNYFDMEVNGASIRSSGPNTAAPNYGTIGLSSDFRGHIALRRTSSTVSHIMHNATISATAGGTSVAPEAGKPFIVGNTWWGTGLKATSYSECNFGFTMATKAFDTNEWAAARTIITTFQTALGRANP